MARYDKYEPKGGGFRAPLAADMAATPDGVGGTNPAIAVGLDANGEVVPGDGNSGIVGVVCLTQTRRAGEIIDVMTDGDVVEFGGVAGTVYYGNPNDGSITTDTDTVGDGTGDPTIRLGHTVEGGRLVVRVAR